MTEPKDSGPIEPKTSRIESPTCKVFTCDKLQDGSGYCADHHPVTPSPPVELAAEGSEGVTHHAASLALINSGAHSDPWETLKRYIAQQADREEESAREVAGLRANLDEAYRIERSARNTLKRLTAERDTARASLTEAQTQLARAEAEGKGLRMKLRERDICWHCKDALIEPEGRPHCENCPQDGDCDDEACSEDGCREEREPTQHPNIGSGGGDERGDYCPRCDAIHPLRADKCSCGERLIKQPDLDDRCSCGHRYGAHTYGTRGPCEDCSTCRRWNPDATPAPSEVERFVTRAELVAALLFADRWSNDAGYRRVADELERTGAKP